jgi:hypothetical protein
MTRDLMRSGCALLGVLWVAACAQAQPVHLDLTGLFDTDAVLEPGGAPLSDPLAPDRDRIDGATLPAGYADGAAYTPAAGGASFRFAPLKSSSRDAAAINGQVLAAPPGSYENLDLALLAAPDSFGDPFSSIQFRYTDGSSTTERFGPVAGWFASPTAFDHSFYNFTDSSGVTSLVSFRTDWSDNEQTYLSDSRGNGNAGGVRFVDGTGYALYLIPLSKDLKAATLGITVGNNFVISLATQYSDPQVSTTDGYTMVANSMTIYNGFEHRSLGNLKLYEFDLAPFLAQGTGELYILFTDATPSNGWGPYIQNINIYTGTNRIFANTFAPALVTNQATVYAEFLTDGGAAEKPYLYDNSGNGPSNRKHRFADGSGSLTYRFDLPDSVTDAKVTVDMANNFIVSLSGPMSITRYAQMTPGSNEKDYLIDDGNSVLGGNFRFADGSAYMVYQFDLPDDVTTAVAQISVGNQFVIEIASGTDGEFVKARDYVAETGNEIRDNSNFQVYEFKLDSYLPNNPRKIVRIRLSDGQPADGWGPYLTSINVVDRGDTGQPAFQPVLNSMTLFGVDVHNELNKGYYTIDLSPVLKANNPKKEVYLKFTDASTGDGWGPGIFWMAAYSGSLQIQSDGSVFAGLKAMNGEPEGFGVNVLHRRYPLNSAKTLKEIVLPQQSTVVAGKTYLMAATLNPAAPAEVELAAALKAGNSLVLSWPATAAGYTLESAGALGGAWSPVSQTIVVEGGRNTVTVPLSGGAAFYRVRK